jgi:predicted CxxxxCH...CXXCH cytochrome family protein
MPANILDGFRPHILGVVNTAIAVSIAVEALLLVAVDWTATLAQSDQCVHCHGRIAQIVQRTDVEQIGSPLVSYVVETYLAQRRSPQT